MSSGAGLAEVMAGITFSHVNIIAKDWRALSNICQVAFGCAPVPPVRKLSGAWLEAATGVPGAELGGEHLRLPGHAAGGPTLETFACADNRGGLPGS